MEEIELIRGDSSDIYEFSSKQVSSLDDSWDGSWIISSSLGEEPLIVGNLIKNKDILNDDSLINEDYKKSVKLFEAETGEEVIFNDDLIVTSEVPTPIIIDPINLSLLKNETKTFPILELIPENSGLDINIESALVISPIESSNNLIFNIVGNSLEVSTALEYIGTESFTIIITDGENTLENTLNIEVKEIDDSLTITEDIPETFGATDIIDAYTILDTSDINNLIINDVNNFHNCSVLLNADNTITITPNTNFTGIATFDYIITDGINIETNEVKVNVNNPPELDIPEQPFEEPEPELDKLVVSGKVMNGDMPVANRYLYITIKGVFVSHSREIKVKTNELGEFSGDINLNKTVKTPENSFFIFQIFPTDSEKLIDSSYVVTVEVRQIDENNILSFRKEVFQAKLKIKSQGIKPEFLV